MFLTIIAVVFTAILLAGAAAGYIRHRVYLVQISYTDINDLSSIPSGVWENITILTAQAIRGTHLTVRVGYFGICAAQDELSWNCRRDSDNLMALHRFTDPLGVINMAEKVKDDVMFPGFL